MNKRIKPFIKWVGGKGQFIDRLIKLIPEYKRYIEPFVGGGAMFFALQPNKFIINDINYELITTYKVLSQERERERERESAIITFKSWKKSLFKLLSKNKKN